MSELTGLIRSFIQMLLRNKGKIFWIPVIAVLWIPFLFPYSDLRSVVATTLSRALGDGTSIDFNQAHLAIGFPIALELENFEFMAPGLPMIAADRLTARPSLMSLLSQAPAGSIEAEGLFQGNVVASLASGSKLKSGARSQEITASITGLQLAALTEAFRRSGALSFNVQGILDSTTSITMDPQFEEQPQGEVFLQAKTISIPTVSVPIPNMGPVQTPSLQLGRVEFKGRMAEGKVQIEDFSFGQGSDSLTGRVRGEMGLTLTRQDQRLRMTPGAFDLRVELNISKSLMDAMSKSGVALALLIVEKHKTMNGENSRFAFRVRASQFGAPPTFESLP